MITKEESDRIKLEWLHSPKKQMEAIVEFMDKHQFPKGGLTPFGRLEEWYFADKNRTASTVFCALLFILGLAIGLVVK